MNTLQILNNTIKEDQEAEFIRQFITDGKYIWSLFLSRLLDQYFYNLTNVIDNIVTDNITYNKNVNLGCLYPKNSLPIHIGTIEPLSWPCVYSLKITQGQRQQGSNAIPVIMSYGNTYTYTFYGEEVLNDQQAVINVKWPSWIENMVGSIISSPGTTSLVPIQIRYPVSVVIDIINSFPQTLNILEKTQTLNMYSTAHCDKEKLAIICYALVQISCASKA